MQKSVVPEFDCCSFGAGRRGRATGSNLHQLKALPDFGRRVCSGMALHKSRQGRVRKAKKDVRKPNWVWMEQARFCCNGRQ